MIQAKNKTTTIQITKYINQPIGVAIISEVALKPPEAVVSSWEIKGLSEEAQTWEKERKPKVIVNNNSKYFKYFINKV